MKGGQTAYTRNWVWNRLADGNGDHSPRHLLLLFYEAIRWERKEQDKNNPYARAIIRPRALTRCLAEVSQQATGALREEFPELTPVFECLERVKQTPVDADPLVQDLAGHHDLLALAREVGLIAPYEQRGDDVRRYKVPDLYRAGLGMTRRGQA